MPVLSAPAATRQHSFLKDMIVVNERGEQHKIVDLNKDGTIAVQPVKVGGKISWRALASDFCTLEERKKGHIWPLPEVFQKHSSSLPRRRIIS